MIETFLTCDTCKKKNEKPGKVSKMVAFEDNLDDIVENMVVVVNDKIDQYNREQYFKIAHKLGVKTGQKTTKHEVIKLINDVLTKRDEEKEKILKEALVKREVVEKGLELNGILVLSREDGYINATALCKAGNKLFGHWKCLDGTKELLEAASLDIGYPISDLIQIKMGGKDKGTWIHPILSVPLAQWVSNIFMIKVSNWTRQLLITGTMTLGQEKTNQQLIILQNEKRKDAKIIKDLKQDKKKILKKRSHHKFHKGPVFYIFSKNDEFKLGFEGEDVNERFKPHRTSAPGFKLHYLFYTDKAYLLEQCMLSRFEKKKLEANHEFVTDIEINTLIDGANTIISFLNIEGTLVTEHELEEYNES